MYVKVEFSSPVQRHFSGTICKVVGTSDKIHRHPARTDRVRLKMKHKPSRSKRAITFGVSLQRKIDIVSGDERDKPSGYSIITIHYSTAESIYHDRYNFKKKMFANSFIVTKKIFLV